MSKVSFLFPLPNEWLIYLFGSIHPSEFNISSSNRQLHILTEFQDMFPRNGEYAIHLFKS